MSQRSLLGHVGLCRRFPQAGDSVIFASPHGMVELVAWEPHWRAARESHCPRSQANPNLSATTGTNNFDHLLTVRWNSELGGQRRIYTDNDRLSASGHRGSAGNVDKEDVKPRAFPSEGSSPTSRHDRSAAHLVHAAATTPTKWELTTGNERAEKSGREMKVGSGWPGPGAGGFSGGGGGVVVVSVVVVVGSESESIVRLQGVVQSAAGMSPLAMRAWLPGMAGHDSEDQGKVLPVISSFPSSQPSAPFISSDATQ
ncbi:hypothetical protein F4775DRAFT_588072 [Biscogniauxia sp. FL1348]|nr:hypothetical protein F4775DRAFT_588072 [Biscogniauxia sp. FL1348]